MTDILAEIKAERRRQDEKWGEQNHRDGTGLVYARDAELARHRCQRAFANGAGTWQHILDEEVAEAYAEWDPAKLRDELIQVAAVAVAWAQAIDRRAAASLDVTPEPDDRCAQCEHHVRFHQPDGCWYVSVGTGKDVGCACSLVRNAGGGEATPTTRRVCGCSVNVASGHSTVCEGHRDSRYPWQCSCTRCKGGA